MKDADVAKMKMESLSLVDDLGKISQVVSGLGKMTEDQPKVRAVNN